MHTGAIIGTIATLLTGIGVGGYFISDYLSERIDTKLQGTKVSGDADWAKKIVAVKANNKELVTDLAKLTEAKELENWCNINYSAKFKDNKDLRFKNVQTYCVYNNKDKLNNPIEEGGDWSKVNEALKGKTPDTNLSATMREIKSKLLEPSKTDENALKKWCLNYYKQIWKTDGDSNFADANEYCLVKG